MDFPSVVDLEGMKSEEKIEKEEELKIIEGSSSSASTSSSQNEKEESFLPIIKTEIKKMGVEISDERAEQLKNDVRRLSPEVVSLRERTLGEISLTPDSSFFDGENPKPDEKYNETNNIAEFLMEELEDVQEEEEKPSASPKPEFDSTLKLNDEFSSDSVDDVLVDIDSRTADDDKQKIANENEEALHRDETSSSSSMSKSVIQKLAVDEEIVFGGENNVAHVQLQSSSSSSPSPTSSSISFIIAYPEASPQSCSSTGENQEQDPLRETEETDSDSSERSSLQNNTINVSDTQSQNSASDTLASCLSTPRDIPIIEAEQFTEDSAESLALATGNGDEVRSDGSDSGLGGEISTELNGGQSTAQESDSETSFLDRIPDDILAGDKDKNASGQLDEFAAVQEDADPLGSCQIPRPVLLTTPILPALRSPPKSNLKRRLTDCMEGSPNPKRINNPDESQKKKRNIHFDAVTVYYFPRAQGFTCVPSQGGSTLGMSAAHTHAERFSLTEHAAEQRRIHRARLAQLRSERAANNVVEAASSSEDPSDDTDEEPSDTEELDIDSYYFLLPVPTWQRRALLRAAGVQKIDTVEKDECRDIRASRKHCGCGCKGYCDPESCPCSRAHVKCQVDRAGFPCGCSRDGCANSSGRIEFNPVRVRTHFIHTLMRLELEKKHREEDCLESQPPVLQGPLRGVLPLAPNPDLASCSINGSGFTTLHYPNPSDIGTSSSSSSCQPEIPGTREDSLDLYAIRDDCYPTSEDAVDGVHHHHHQRKHLLHPQEFGQQNFQQQFQQQTSYQDYQGYQQTLPSTSRGQFHHPQYQQTGFGHYSGYVGDTSMSQHPQNLYDQSYLTPQDEGTSGASQYTNLNSVQPSSLQIGNNSPVSVVHAPSSHHQQIVGKLEPFSELLAGRYSYYGEIEPNQTHVVSGYPGANGGAKSEGDKILINETVESSVETDNQNVNTGADDYDENFGEIIKKSMVETVSA